MIKGVISTVKFTLDKDLILKTLERNVKIVVLRVATKGKAFRWQKEMGKYKIKKDWMKAGKNE